MRRWTTLAAVLTAGALMVGVNPVANATELTGIYCELSTSEGIVKIDATALYFDEPSTGIRSWRRFSYRLHGELNRTQK